MSLEGFTLGVQAVAGIVGIYNGLDALNSRGELTALQKELIGKQISELDRMEALRDAFGPDSTTYTVEGMADLQAELNYASNAKLQSQAREELRLDRVSNHLGTSSGIVGSN